MYICICIWEEEREKRERNAVVLIGLLPMCLRQLGLEAGVPICLSPVAGRVSVTSAIITVSDCLPHWEAGSEQSQVWNPGPPLCDIGILLNSRPKAHPIVGF